MGLISLTSPVLSAVAILYVDAVLCLVCVVCVLMNCYQTYHFYRRLRRLDSNRASTFFGNSRRELPYNDSIFAPKLEYFERRTTKTR